MFLKSRKNRSNPSIINSTSIGVTKAIADIWVKWKQAWAIKMQRSSERLSRESKIIILMTYCVLAGACCVYRIAGRQMISFSIIQITKPMHVNQHSEERVTAPISISKSEYKKVAEFKKYMDSLARSPDGKTLYKNILNDRPGLMDSIALLDKLYQSQIKK